jgi:putative ABC transport system permease protein
MRDIVGAAVADQRFAARLAGACGVIGALIAVLGLYAATAHVAGQRVHELAIRSVLGATRRQAMRSMLAECGLPAVAGLAVGTFSAIWLSRFVAGFVHGVSALDPASFALASLVLGTTCLVAIYVPVAKATRLDPLVVLRAE